MNDDNFYREHRRELDLHRAARRLLGVGETASETEIKRAWRNACRQTHPDLHPDDPEAERKFKLVNCAYELLTGGQPCDELVALHMAPERPATRGKYDLSNPWGMYLWWRERFF